MTKPLTFYDLEQEVHWEISAGVDDLSVTLDQGPFGHQSSSLTGEQARALAAYITEKFGLKDD